MLSWMKLTSLLLIRRGRHRHQRTMLWTQRPHCCRLGKQLARQRLNVSSGRAAALIREALKSRELRIIRDDHIDPISSSLFAIVEEDFLGWLNRHASITATTPQAARKQPDRELVRQAAIELWGTPGPPDHLSNLSICREVAQWLKKNDQAAEISDATILRAVGRK